MGTRFAPLATVVCVDYLVRKGDVSNKAFDVPNLALWIGGFALYRLSIDWILPCGNTLPIMVIIAIATAGVSALRR